MCCHALRWLIISPLIDPRGRIFLVRVQALDIGAVPQRKEELVENAGDGRPPQDDLDVARLEKIVIAPVACAHPAEVVVDAHDLGMDDAGKGDETPLRLGDDGEADLDARQARRPGPRIPVEQRERDSRRFPRRSQSRRAVGGPPAVSLHRRRLRA